MIAFIEPLVKPTGDSFIRVFLGMQTEAFQSLIYAFQFIIEMN